MNTYTTLTPSVMECQMMLASPLEQFEVNKLVGLDAPVIGLNFSLTNLGFYVLLVLIVFIGAQVLSLNSSPQGALLVPSR